MARKKQEVEEIDDLDLTDGVEEDDDLDLSDVEDEDEAPTKSKRSTKAKAESKPAGKRGRQLSEGTVGAGDLAEKLGVDGRSLRMLLRARAAEGHDCHVNPDNKRYEWPSIDAAIESAGFDSIDEMKEALDASKKEAIDKLKERGKAKREAAKAEKATPSSAKKTPDPSDDEDELDLDDEG